MNEYFHNAMWKMERATNRSKRIRVGSIGKNDVHVKLIRVPKL